MATAVKQDITTDRSSLTVTPPADTPAPSRRRFVLPVVAVLALLGAAKAAAEAAAANLVAFERQAGAAGGSVAGARAGVRLAQARLAAAQAAVDNARLQLAYTRIAAPAGGIVSRAQVERGQLIQ